MAADSLRAVPRRGVLRMLGGGAAAALAAGALGACAATGAASGGGPSAPRTAAPQQAAGHTITLLWRPWYNFNEGTSKLGLQLLYDGTAPFRASHKGVDFRLTALGYQGATIAAILAGNGPDVFEDWVFPPYIENNLLLDLQPYMRKANLDLSVYPSSYVSYFREIGSFSPKAAGFFVLPDYVHTLGQAVNLGVLDQLGVAYPEPGWTWADWTRFWTATAKRSTNPQRRRYGGQFYMSGYDYYGGNPAPWYWHGFGGGFVQPGAPTHCHLAAPGSIRFAEWAFPLMREQIIGYGHFRAGQQVSEPRGTAGGLLYSAEQWRGLKWAIYPMPVWPDGKAWTFGVASGYAANAATKHPDLCWEFIEWLCHEPAWPRYMMRLALIGPILNSLWSEWETIVTSVAPTLKDKQLHYLTQTVRDDLLYVGKSFKYADAATARAINHWTGLAQAGKVPVAQALPEAAAQVDALQLAAAAQSGVAAQALRRFPVRGRSIARVTPGL